MRQLEKLVAFEAVNECAYRDRRIGETVNTLSQTDLYLIVSSKVGDCTLASISRYTQGEVSADSRGTGTNQYPDRVNAANEKRLKGWDEVK
jgi:hypothetical protein